MRDTTPLPPVLIASATRPGMTRTAQRAAMTRLRRTALAAGYDVIPAIGYWQGAREPSVVLVPRPTATLSPEALARRILFTFHQEAVVFAGPDRRAVLIHRAPGRAAADLATTVTALGPLVGSPSRPAAAGYTYVPHLRTYYVAQEGK